MGTDHEITHFRLNVARLANLPGDVISIAGEKSHAMEEDTEIRERHRWYVFTFNSDSRADKARHLLQRVDLDTLKELAKRLD
jgi:hypothetical protein